MIVHEPPLVDVAPPELDDTPDDADRPDDELLDEELLDEDDGVPVELVPVFVELVPVFVELVPVLVELVLVADEVAATVFAPKTAAVAVTAVAASVVPQVRARTRRRPLSRRRTACAWLLLDGAAGACGEVVMTVRLPGLLLAPAQATSAFPQTGLSRPAG